MSSHVKNKEVGEKYATVLSKNSFYFSNPVFEQEYEAYINGLKESLLYLKSLSQGGLSKEIVTNFLIEKEFGLRAVLALTGFSNESFKRLITLVRVVDDEELSRVSNKAKWCEDVDPGKVQEWSDANIARLLKQNADFREGMVNLFFEGATIPFLTKTMPLFELKKLSVSKFDFEIEPMVDSLIRYKEKGSYSGKKENNPEGLIEKILEELSISHEKGDLSELISNAPDTKRTMDFIIPNKKDPVLIIESSYLVTTSSGQGDKSKTEISINALIKQHYPKAQFIGFVDGIGWYVRRGDLKRMVTAYSDVFTYHEEELNRFKALLIKSFQS